MRVLVSLLMALLVMISVGRAKKIYVGNEPTRFGLSGNEDNFYNELQQGLDQAGDGDTVIIAPGTFQATSVAFTETLCGNCEKHVTRVQASHGFLVENKGLCIVGSGPDSSILVTNAGYGMLFVNSTGSLISNVKITGGKRDRDGNATDAAIVARNSKLIISGCLIADNTDRPESLVVGIGGVFGREGAELIIENNRLSNNGWDGIALYRGATALICDNDINGGRGAGIGITWDAAAQVYRNKIRNYWKGIGAFGASRAIVSNNLVTDNLGWGVIVTGSAYLDCTNNLVIHNGNCGLAIWSDSSSGRFANNIVVDNGWRDEWVCPQVGLWNYGYPDRFIISCNDLFNNRGGQYRDMPDQTDRFGNISADPRFMSADDYRLAPDSPCLNTGDLSITDRDGSRSDMGIYGGPRAR